MQAMEAVFYSRRVEKDVSKLSFQMQDDFSQTLQLMQKRGTWNLGMPHVRHISGTPLYEIRLNDADGIARVMFISLESKQIMVLHAFAKKTQATPKKEIAIAMKRLKEVKHGR